MFELKLKYVHAAFSSYKDDWCVLDEIFYD